MKQLSDSEIQLIKEFPNLYQQVSSVLKLAYWFFAVTLVGWVITAFVLLVTFS